MIMYTLYWDEVALPVTTLVAELRNAKVPPHTSVLWNMEGDVRVVPWQVIQNKWQELLDLRRAKEKRLWGFNAPESSIYVHRSHTEKVALSDLRPVKFNRRLP